jgi:hypothetical protein
VNVTGNIFFGATPFSSKRATRRFIANDLPVPGPATTLILVFDDAAIEWDCDPGVRLLSQLISFRLPQWQWTLLHDRRLLGQGLKAAEGLSGPFTCKAGLNE